MNKTISINMGGMVFQIDEEAYSILEKYLGSLKKHFAGTEGSEEIIQDIEARIAEIFQTKIEAGQMLILPEKVEEAIKILGNPADIDNNASEKEPREESGRWTKKRLFRDEDNRVLGGVCSGLGHYLDVDPVWFRIIFIISLFFAGTGAVVYLVLWIIIPKATSTEDRMNMRGTPLTISEIEQNIKNEFQDLKARFQDIKGSAKRRTHREMHEMKRKMRQAKREAKYSHRQRQMASAIAAVKPERSSRSGFGSVLGEIIYYLLRAFLIFVGIVLLIIAIVLTGSLILSLTASDSFLFFTKWGISSVSMPAFSGLFFENLWQQQFLILSLILLIGVPLIMLIFNSVRLIIGFRTKVRIVSITASLLWLVGLVMIVILTMNIVGNFSEKSTVKQEIVLPQTTDLLTVDVADNLPELRSINQLNDEFGFGGEEDHQRFIFNNCYFSDRGDKVLAYGFPKLKIIPSQTASYKITVLKFARGTSIMAARERAEAIDAGVIANDSVLILNNYFVLPGNEKWRNQSVKILLEVPEGKSIFMTNNVENLIYDRDNIDASWNFDMIGKKLTMHHGRLKAGYEPVKTDSIPVKKADQKSSKPVVMNQELLCVPCSSVFV